MKKDLHLTLEHLEIMIEDLRLLSDRGRHEDRIKIRTKYFGSVNELYILYAVDPEDVWVGRIFEEGETSSSSFILYDKNWKPYFVDSEDYPKFSDIIDHVGLIEDLGKPLDLRRFKGKKLRLLKEIHKGLNQLLLEIAPYYDRSATAFETDPEVLDHVRHLRGVLEALEDQAKWSSDWADIEYAVKGMRSLVKNMLYTTKDQIEHVRSMVSLWEEKGETRFDSDELDDVLYVYRTNLLKKLRNIVEFLMPFDTFSREQRIELEQMMADTGIWGKIKVT